MLTLKTAAEIVLQKEAFNTKTDIHPNMDPRDAAIWIAKVQKDPEQGNQWVYTGGEDRNTGKPPIIPEDKYQLLRQKADESAAQPTTPQPAAPAAPEAPASETVPGNAPLAADPAATAPADPTAPAADPLADLAQNEQTAPAEFSVQQLAQQLHNASEAFAKAYNDQIRVYNPALKSIRQTLKSISSNPRIQYSPAITGKLQQLISMLQSAMAEESQDAQLINQLVPLAQEVSQLVGAPPAAPQKAPSPTPQAPAPTQNAPAAPPPNNQGWGQNMGNWFGNLMNIPGNIGRGFQRARERGANSDRPILTASMGSASRMFLDE